MKRHGVMHGLMGLYWWDDALALADRRARATGVRHMVRRNSRGMWQVSPR
ncbi:hypothetical protein [Nocardioides sp. InS609-2]|nr:hypothetical protein [Nocardioides sp. InS609-2]